MQKKMAHSNIVVFAILLVFSCSFLANAASLVPDTCKKIAQSDPNVKVDFCVTAFASDPHSSAATLSDLGNISFELGITKGKSISSSIDKFLKDPKFDPFAKNALKACKDLYKDAPTDLQDGLNALKQKDFDTANVQASAAMDSASTCEDGFKEKTGEVSPLTKDNNDFFQLTAISLGFTVLLKQ